MNKFINFCLVTMICISCAKENKLLSVDDVNNQKEGFLESEFNNWELKDVVIDTIPGLSMERVNSLLINKINNNVILAFIDSEIDFNHKDIKNRIWFNRNEIPNNKIDDDNNGYIDDVNGWNFLGYNNTESIIFSRYEYTRILGKYDSIFKEKLKEQISYKDTLAFNNYQRALRYYKIRMDFANEDVQYANMLLSSMKNVKMILKSHFPDEKYGLKELDSMKELSNQDSTLINAILIRSNFFKYNYSQEFMENYKIEAKERIDKLLNINYNERKLIDKNSDIIEDKVYGNGVLNRNLNFFRHGTKLAGQIAKLKKDNLKIMSLVVSPKGDEHDKDIALAIYYAVDNGAKVINMSFGKDFSLHKEWVDKAIKYAEAKNVLIVSSAGNSSTDLNVHNNYYPNDNVDNGVEIADNFLLVGAISPYLDKRILPYFTNYGNIDVDLFAPGDKIYTTVPFDKYEFDGGTSLAAATTTGIAGMLFSYYPNLTASQVKHILMDSGLSLDIEVELTDHNDSITKVPFKSLSKSGKILNAYNAFVMAEEISKR